MFLCISGFLPDNSHDDSLKFELCLDPSYNEKIVKL
ncbi:pyocin S6 family toxin immunity protein [Pseudomonas gingeri]|nr:pyocin S6 family toxin immunity protein [Pseudomonas gingeri]